MDDIFTNKQNESVFRKSYGIYVIRYLNTQRMDYFRRAVDTIEWNKFPLIASVTDMFSAKLHLKNSPPRNDYAEKNRHTWEIALDQLRYEERAARRRNEERRA